MNDNINIPMGGVSVGNRPEPNRVDRVTFSRKQLQYLESLYGTRESHSRLVLPDSNVSTIMYEAGMQCVLDSIRSRTV